MMKKTYLFPFLFMMLAALMVHSSCSKKDDKQINNTGGNNTGGSNTGGNDEGISPKIKSIISIETLNKFADLGLKINKGNMPPNIEGIFLVNPLTLMVRIDDNDPYPVGKVDKDYKFKFYDQVADDVKMDYKDAANIDKGAGVGSFISGSGNAFTLYGETAGTESGISYKAVLIISGEISAQGIKDLQFAAILTDKTGDDKNAVLQPKGTGRIWKDGNALASVITSF